MGEPVDDTAPATLPFAPETALERRIFADREWREAMRWGQPRAGHPEGSVAAHVAEVLQNVDRLALDADDRRRLRLVALLHDAGKRRVDRTRPQTRENHHARISRRLAERHLDDAELLELIELHDDAFNAWKRGRRSGSWDRAEERARRLIERLGPALPAYLRFYRADNATGSKDPRPLAWFEQLAARYVA